MSVRCAVCQAEAPDAQEEGAAFCGHCGGALLAADGLPVGTRAAATEGPQRSAAAVGPPPTKAQAVRTGAAGDSPLASQPQGGGSSLGKSPLARSTHELFSGLPSRKPSGASPSSAAQNDALETGSSGGSSTIFSLEALMRGSDSQVEQAAEPVAPSPPVLLDLPAAAPIFGASADEALLTAALPSKAPRASVLPTSAGRSWTVAAASLVGVSLLGVAVWAFWPEIVAGQRSSDAAATQAPDEPTTQPSGDSTAQASDEPNASGKASPPEGSSPSGSGAQASGAVRLGLSASSSFPPDAEAGSVPAVPAPSAAGAGAVGAVAVGPAPTATSPESKPRVAPLAASAAKPQAKATKRKTKRRRRSAKRKRRRTPAPRAAAGPGTPTAPAATPAPKALLGGSPFDARAAKRALGGAAQRAASCSRGDSLGRGKVQLTFSISGRVQSAKLTEGPFRGTSAGECILGHFRKARVPTFTGRPVTVSKSVTLR